MVSIPDASIACVLAKFKSFHRLYFKKLKHMRDVKTLLYIADESNNNDLALVDLLNPILDAPEDPEALNALYALFKEFLIHVCEGMIALILEQFGKNPDLSPQLPESNIDIVSLSDVFRNDIDGVGLLIYNLTLAAEPLNHIIFGKDDIELLEEVIRAVRQVQLFYPDFLSKYKFPKLPMSRPESDASLEDTSSDDMSVTDEVEEPVVPHPHADYLEKLFTAFDAFEVLDGSVDVKPLMDQIPADLVVDDMIWDRCIRVIKVLTPSNPDDPQTEAVVELLHTLFSRVPDVNTALHVYWQNCHEASGPLAFGRFNVRRGLRKFERSMGNHNQTSEEEIKPVIELLAWLLIGDTRATLTSILKELIQNEQLVHFFRKTVRYLPIVNTYETSSGFNLILLTMADIIADLHASNQTTPMTQASILLTKLSQSFNDNTPGIIPPTQLLDFAVKQSFDPESSTLFWLRVAWKLVEGTTSGRRSYVINWDATSKLPHNPWVLAVFMLKLLATKKSADIGPIKGIMDALSKILASTSELKEGWHALDAVDDVHWAIKFAAVQRLRIPDSQYKLQIPSAMYNVLNEQDKARYRELRYGGSSLADFLKALFEIGLIGGDVPGVFFQAAAARYFRTENSNVLGLALLTALKNVRKIGVETFEPTMFDLINRIATALNYEVFAPLVDAWTPQTFKTLSNLQSIRFIALAFRIAVEMHLNANALGEEKVKAEDLVPEAQLLLTTYCTAAYKRVTELREAFKKEECFKRTGTATDCNVMAFSAFLNAVSALFVDTLNLGILLEPLPDELTSLLRELNAARKQAERQMVTSFNTLVPKPPDTRPKKGKQQEEKKEAEPKPNGVNDAITAAGDAKVQTDVEKTPSRPDATEATADQQQQPGSSNETDFNASNAPGKRPFKNSYRNNPGRGGRRYRGNHQGGNDRTQNGQ
uniref:SOSS complex subunit A homolog n=1 Tax=Panagrellus redivivus TaxID=6233 RepID=A0A7E4W303_PANRE